MSTNLGMPRVGRKRELKFATEKYWRQEITASELLSIATDVVDDIYNQGVTSFAGTTRTLMGNRKSKLGQ